MGSKAFVLVAAIFSAIAAETFLVILAILLTSRLAKQTVSIWPFLFQ